MDDESLEKRPCDTANGSHRWNEKWNSKSTNQVNLEKRSVYKDDLLIGMQRKKIAVGG